MRRVARRLLVGWGLVCALVACDADKEGASSRIGLDSPAYGVVEGAIIDGYEDTESKEAVLLLFYPDPNPPYPLCTGTLIAPNVVLTAQQCVADLVDYNTCGYGATYAPANLLVSTADTASQVADVNLYGVVEVHVPAPELTPPICGNDIALLVLSGSIVSEEATPMVPRVDIPMGNGEAYSAVGYGYINGSGVGAGVRRRIDGLTSVCVEAYCGQPTLQNEWIGPGKMCEGDSGGPAVDLQNRQVGIASAYLGASCDSSYSLYSHLYAWADWLKERTSAVTQAYGVAVPKWALGWPTDPVYGYPVGGFCEQDDTCPSGLCVDGICSRQCAENAPCPAGFSCEGEPALCTPIPLGEPCEVVGDPAGDPACASGLCKDGFCTRPCEGNLEVCPPSYVCEEGACTLYPLGGTCEVGEDCLSGLCSEEGYCTYLCDEEAPCAHPNYGCEESSGLCELFAVGAPCVEEEECPSLVCVGGMCSRWCDETMSCPDGYVCLDEGVCGEPEEDECQEDAQCPEGWCFEGDCVDTCSSEVPCPEGWVCDEASGSCVEFSTPQPDVEEPDTRSEEDSEISGEDTEEEADMEEQAPRVDAQEEGQGEAEGLFVDEPETEVFDNESLNEEGGPSLSAAQGGAGGCQSGPSAAFPLGLGTLMLWIGAGAWMRKKRIHQNGKERGL